MLAAPPSNRFLMRVKSEVSQAAKTSECQGLVLTNLTATFKVGDNQALDRMWTANSNSTTFEPKRPNQIRNLARSFFLYALDSNFAIAAMFPNRDAPSDIGSGRKPLLSHRYVHECCVRTRFVSESCVMLSVSNKPFPKPWCLDVEGHGTDLPKSSAIFRALHSVAAAVVDYGFG